MKLSSLTAISPIDGRYSDKVNMLTPIFSEFGLLKYRIQIEIKWLQKLAECNKIKEIPMFTDKAKIYLDNIIKNFDENDAIRIKQIEKTTVHDVKAIELFLKEKMTAIPELEKVKEFIHFACTSEDINNLAYALILKNATDKIIIIQWKKIINNIKNMAYLYRKLPLLSRTHGQPATPTTIGKEFANVVYRMTRQYQQLQKIEILGKINGAVGNYNAHMAAYPNINWHLFSKEFVTSLNIKWNPFTTQIEPHDYIAELLNCISRFNTILIDFNQDIWGYIALNHFKQKTIEDEIGSSTMPYKVNPIDFENSEANLGLANALFNHLVNKLPISRWQRDLTDSTVLRNLGVGFAYSLIAYKAMLKGLTKLEVNKQNLKSELDANWIVITEAIQTIMRKYRIKNAYEKLKTLTRGKYLTKDDIKCFIDDLELPEAEKIFLKNIKPDKYIGYSINLVNSLRDLNNKIYK
ncbi:Adenylosuccinate lyase [Candidatus Arsenophonus lipoptenae]|uniref:Adenylosuccinate lyase n=1 Tax=Candidatus Arsenophonus lipoptenae TaxID=634113 RepID=A0A0X9VVS3_9GAMM|nr:adenylosuccinate lyase [Candidatus Arsenophonus lipoptenae]AMA65088.1 Adenylosuccinate lyase [Candidatus Arsenophonus lipoptenae]